MSNRIPNDELIGLLYRQIVGRAADPEGLAYHAALLMAGPTAEATESLVQNMLSSEEGSNHLVRGLYLRASPNLRLRDREIISLGTHCFTSFLLKGFSLKSFSAPFDWLFSSPSMVAHCLNDGFETFLDARHYEPVPLERRRDGENVNKVDHAFYRDEHDIEFVFNHHNVHEEGDYQSMRRCVERFNRCAASDARKTYLLVRAESPTTDTDFETVAAAVEKNTTNGSLLYVAVSTLAEGLPMLTERAGNGKHKLITLNPSSAWNALTFSDVIDELAILKAVAAM
jgi:hypothetical protein